MRAAICEDLPEHRDHLALLLEDYCAAHGLPLQLKAFESAEELLDSWRPRAFDLVFMDVYLGGMSGVEAARRVRREDEDCAIVFTTTSEEHAMVGYEVRAAGYLLKPFGRRELEEVLDWQLEEMGDALRSMEVISDRERQRLPLRDIQYAEVYGRVSVIHAAGGAVNVNMSLAELESALDTGDFLRCHRSYLVNMNYIKRPTADGLLLYSGEVVPVGADNAPRVRQTFFDWAFHKTWEGRSGGCPNSLPTGSGRR